MRRQCWVALLLLAAGIARADDHANQAAQGTPITPGSSLAGSLETGGDVDFFRFTGQAGARYRLETETGSANMDTLLAVFAPTGAALGEDDDSGAGYLSRIEVTAASDGTYYARVRHYRANGTGTYRLRLTLLAAPTPAPNPTPAPAPTPTPNTSSAHQLAAARVFDPRLGGGANLDVTTQAAGSGSYQASLAVIDAAGNQLRALVGNAARQAGQSYRDGWDGRDAQGRHLAPGRYGLRFVVTRNGQSERVDRTLYLVRLGARAIAFGDRGNAERVQLSFHHSSASASSSPFAVDAAGPAWTLARSPLGAECLDASDGSPLAGPAPWTDPARPPLEGAGAVATRGRSLPVAYRLDSSPRLLVQLGAQAAANGQAVPAGWPIQGVPLRVVVGGQAALAGAASAPLVAGQAAQIDLPAQFGGVGSALLELQLRFEYQENGAWSPVPGAQRTQHTFYRVLGQPTGGVAWVGAIALATGFAGGAPRSESDLLSALVWGVNRNQGLRYDDVLGAAVYTDQDYVFELRAYLDGQRNGRTINCTDCASLVSALANQVGGASRVVTIGWNFSLYWIRGIGASDFGHSLFGGAHAFSYHDIASRDQGQTVHDACLSVDDDGQPWSAPFTERLPQGMGMTSYLRDLTPDVGSWGGGPQLQTTTAVRVR